MNGRTAVKRKNSEIHLYAYQKENIDFFFTDIYVSLQSLASTLSNMEK